MQRVEDLIVSGRRKCNHVMIRDESHLYRIVRSCLAYYLGTGSIFLSLKQQGIGGTSAGISKTRYDRGTTRSRRILSLLHRTSCLTIYVVNPNGVFKSAG